MPLSVKKKVCYVKRKYYLTGDVPIFSRVSVLVSSLVINVVPDIL